MAHHPRTSETETTPTTGRNDGLTRRNYVRSLAAVATAATSLGAAGTVVADDDYEVIEAEGQTITIDSGETWENKLIDMTTGQDIVVTAHGTDWTIQNVGFDGKNTSGTGSATFGLSDSDPSGSSTVENVYLGDGSDSHNGSSSGHGQTAFWVDPDHAGHVDFENVNIQEFADNAIYASAPGNAGGGTIHVDRCFAANCYVSHFRLATEGSTVTNSSVYVDDSGYQGRGIWAWAPGTVEVEGCQIEMHGHNVAIDAGANGNPTEVLVSDTDYDDVAGIGENAGSTVELEDDVGTDPDAFVPDGVPQSAEEAASGN
ncbi:hypothetical protein [Natronobacterium gregoryi]|uniref:Right handed beta helix region n=2 Tax=Natronobacterium gregoryi TaxID=44930 RepID=L0AMJ5_NATGS|nr:hypothetical protein [Natronobacterium gregoryi]AFZ74669.1 hypothetical protein Natgr_3554 [Natronobacterium gregoryi SP2]ELY73426.1 hypothetical protein C490_01635 [Natronobacterium gregoryi SP2]PLK20916.1 hypothetical protein CYV19_06545 [Natronobacterium gregoryi SP2]SFJ05199.1 hypothetical protein SAMN05443661_11289 [Natronobacterium gregoryi]